MIADDKSCIASESRGESRLIKPYAKNFVTAIRASEVIGPDVDEDRITCKKGCRSEGVSNFLISRYLP